MNNYLFYYNNYRIQHFFLRYLYNRECAVIPSKKSLINSSEKRKMITRNMRVHNTQSFQFWLKFIRMFSDKTRLFNFYYSLAEFNTGIPYRNVKENNLKEDFSSWTENCHKEIRSYDMLIDIDSGSFDEFDFALESAQYLQKRMDNWNVPYHLRFSGMGFHFVIPYKFFPNHLSTDPSSELNIYERMKMISEHLSEDISEMIDTTIYDSRRLTKIPMSLALYPEGDFVCVPVEELSSFDLEHYRLENFKNFAYIPDDILHNNMGNLGVFKEWLKG